MFRLSELNIKQMKKVLILDANQRSALASTRSLGKKGVPVITADETIGTLAGASKYSVESFSYPSPYRYPEFFIETLKKECIDREVKIIFPMTEITTALLLKNRYKIKGRIIPFAEFEIFDLLNNKWKLLELARKLKVPFPKTYFVKTPEDLDKFDLKLEFPVVLKPFRSTIMSGEGWIKTGVKYAGSRKELNDYVKNTQYFNSYPFLIQEYIQGQGHGVFALYNRGAAVTFFAHRRIREKPPSGGVSVLSESVKPDAILKGFSQRILDYARWHGVAMVEYKVSGDGSPFLMEVNARFWGSLQLAINVGLDFPWLLYQLATSQPVDRINSYKEGIKNRWLLGDIDNLFLNLFKTGKKISYPEKWKLIKNFINLYDLKTFYEVNKWDDFKPFLFELKKYLRDIIA